MVIGQIVRHNWNAGSPTDPNFDCRHPLKDPGAFAMNAIVDFPTLATVNAYTQLELNFESDIKTLFSWMNAAPRPCFNAVLVDEIGRSEKLLELHQGHLSDNGKPARVDYVVFGSRTPGVFN